MKDHPKNKRENFRSTSSGKGIVQVASTQHQVKSARHIKETVGKAVTHTAELSRDRMGRSLPILLAFAPKGDTINERRVV